MDVFWLGTGAPPEGVNVMQAESFEQTGDDCLLFVDSTVHLRGKKAASRRIYLVSDGRIPKKLPGAVMGVIPREASVINAMSLLYREMKQSFEVGDLLIRSLGEKDLAIQEKQRLMLMESRRYNAIFRNANDLIFILGPSGKITFCNETFRHHLQEKGESVLGRPFSDFVLEEDRHNLDLMIGRGFEKGVPVRAEVRLMLLTGRNGIFSLLCTPLEEEGRIYALSVIGRDITDIRAMQKRLTIQANDLSQMMNGLAHELRNPLTIIGAYIRRLEREKGERTRKWEEALSGIYSSINRIEDMIGHVERYEKLVKMEPSCCKVELCSLVRQTVRELDAAVPVRVESPGGVHAFCDADHVRVALSRILENAVETGTPEVTVTITRDESYAHVAVRDFGPGVRDKVQTILAPFYSTDPMKTGLGLTEARIAMVKIHGDLEVVRQAEPGAVFTLKILLDRRLRARETA
ncbi:MAG TPA: PAS domain-containing protein [Deltaproteobacteria bacterium]|nr:PAS domain-containing protein [Deltaproteobacteria bacterium]HPR55926.1 PAS domain-containing protein [Deltaproteobacteria bacterium]HXK47795.1 PAS domain-containing protein [Deltaproteobacteria bacterium]